ncbi:MAG: hypothetical protein Q8L79_12065 [Methylobacter sp.]|uniref:hypothetical protein n=1 Tax=Methylobacter sp. TaxID=2051955 RepID=UPI00272F15C5|nr:hypothetical protein [Methylobacter sp.]MDP1665850.1 hypothetical protein [Methylobacter sp.]
MITILLAGLAPMPCSAEFRDPTQPAYPLPSTTGAIADSDNTLVLSAIWISSHSRRATINGVTAKQGQTITIVFKQTPTLKPALVTPASMVTSGDKKDELLNKTMEYATAKTNGPTQENIMSPLGNMIAPLLATAIGSMDIPQLQGQSTEPAETSTRQQPNTVQHAEPTHIPTRSSTIKIISIHKNSVTITQNGELKTLQLVQRPYKTK